jgi:hypothetical protein
MSDQDKNSLDLDVDNLIKYKNIFDNSSVATTAGIAFMVMGVLLWIGGALFGDNIGGLLSAVAPIGVIGGFVVLAIALPIKLINQPKYEDYATRTQLDGTKTPEPAKTALFNYLRNQSYGKKTGRISSVIELIAEVNGDQAMDSVIGVIEDPEYAEPVRTGAIRYLPEFSSINEDLVFDTLYKNYKNQPSAVIRQAVVDALGNIKNLQSANALQEARWDEDKQVRKSAKEALKKLKDAGIQ